MSSEERYYVAIHSAHLNRYMDNRREGSEETLKDVLSPGIRSYYALEIVGPGPLQSQTFGSELDMTRQKRARAAREFGIPEGVLKIVHESVHAEVID